MGLNTSQFTPQQIQAYAEANTIPISEASISLDSMSPIQAQTAMQPITGTGNVYSGTIKGVSAFVNQDGLSTLDPGSVSGAKVGDNLYNSTGPDTNTKKDTGFGAMDYLNAATGLGGLAANIYYSQKNLDLQEDAADYAKSRDAQSDAKKSNFAAKVGGYA